jgi:hypothetical protein
MNRIPVANAADTATVFPLLPILTIEPAVLMALITPIPPPPLAVVPMTTGLIAVTATPTESPGTVREETGVIIPPAVPSKAITAVAARGLIKAPRATARPRAIVVAAKGRLPPEDLMAPAEVGTVIAAIGQGLLIGRIEAIVIMKANVDRPVGGIDTMIIMMRYRDLLPFLSAFTAHGTKLSL